ncbi:MAG: preprotein translocase subunit SecG [Deltaproteobacteria bacterium]|nr:preprotein translocase subunit SecG [Deltaproteobacteria bacterium]
MITLVTVVHILVSIGLILVVLLQTGKGADIGAVFGGSSSTIFGSSGAGNFLTRLTTGMAIVFMLTSLTLGYFSGKKPSASIFDRSSPGVEQPAQKATGQQPQGQPAPSQAPSSSPQPQPPQPQQPKTP